MPNSHLKCTHCNKYFPRDEMLKYNAGNFCTYDHAVAYGRKKAEKKQKQKDENLKRMREEQRSHFWYVDKAEFALRWWVRERDHGKPCHSCTYPGTQAGHYRAKGSCEALRLNAFNLALQCTECNKWRSGAAAEFRIGLINRYGIEKVEWLVGHHPHTKPSKEYLIRFAKIFRKRARLYKRLRENREAIAA